MSNFPTRSDYYFHNGAFILRNKWTKRFKIGVIIGIILGGLIGANATSSHTPDQILMDLIKAPETKMIEYIQSKNKMVSYNDAREIVLSTYKWASEYEIDPYLLFAVQEVESSFNKHAISNAGALGIMQVIPSWHLGKMQTAIRDIGNPELFNINTNIYLGTWVLKNCIKQFNLTKNSLLCYNGSNAKPNGYDNKIMNSYSGIKYYMREA